VIDGGSWQVTRRAAGIKDRSCDPTKADEKIRANPGNIYGTCGTITDAGSALFDGAKQSAPTNQTPIYGIDLLPSPVCSL